MGSSHWTDEALVLLGVLPDPVIAERLGVSKQRVHQKRISLGIPAVRTTHAAVWTEKRLTQLGTQPDDALAESWGFGGSTVRRKRWALGIPAFRKWRNGRKGKRRS